MSEPVLDAVDLAIGYPGHRLLLTDFSLRLQPGEIVGVRGRSGCGKTSLLNVLGGLAQPRSGTVEWRGRTRPRPGDIAAVFQDPFGSLDPRWGIGRTVAEPLLARGVGRDERVREARRALGEVGMGGVGLATKPGQLSGGQCQRVALARAMITHAELILADEPTSALDASISAGVLWLLRAIADRGTALVVVSHDPLSLAALCDRVIDLAEYRPASNVGRTP